MDLTKALREWAVKHLGVAADAADEVFSAAITKALQGGKLKAKDYALMSEPATEDDPRLELANIVSKAVVAGLKAYAGAGGNPGGNAGGTAVLDDPEPEPVDEVERKINKAVDARLAKMHKTPGREPDFASRIMGQSAMSMPRVKKAVEGYSSTRSNAVYPMVTQKNRAHPMGGQQAMIGARGLEVPSNRDKAVIGAVCKWMLWEDCRHTDSLYQPTDEDMDLVHYALEEERWNGSVGCKGNPDAGHYHEGMKLTKDGEYALVNDVATGGAYATPEIWDDAVVLNAVLYGELFPFVQTTNLPKGAFMHGVQLLTDPVINPVPGTGWGANKNFYDYSNPQGNTAPSSTSGTQVIGGITVGVPAYKAPGIGQAYNQPIIEGNSQSGGYETAQEYAVPSGTTTSGLNYLQSMAGIIGNYDVGIFPVVAAIQLGLDWESDSPIAWGNLFVDRMGIKMQEWLDSEIAIGSGNGEPLGLFNSAGATVTPTNNSYGSVGPLVKADLEKLLFGISKAMRASKGGKNFYVMNDQQYRLCRSIPWLAGAAATAQARVYGPDLEEYKLEGHDCKINININSGAMAFANLAYYRMVRRLGMSIKQTTEGLNLTLQNTRLIVGRARWGGRLTKPDALAIMTGAEFPDHGYPASSFGAVYSGGGTYSP